MNWKKLAKWYAISQLPPFRRAAKQMGIPRIQDLLYGKQEPEKEEEEGPRIHRPQIRPLRNLARLPKNFKAPKRWRLPYRPRSRVPSKDGVWAVIAGGGTAGHVMPGLVVAEEILNRGLRTDQLVWLGSERGIETELVPKAGFPISTLPGRGIRRKLTKANLEAITGLFKAFRKSLRLLKELRPAVVLGLGGYASAPVAIAALLKGIPLVITEQNAVAGAANRLVSPFARASAVAFANTGLPKEHHTGNPVRPAVAQIDRVADRAKARQALDITNPNIKLVTIFGGSLGAARINNAALDALLESTPDHHPDWHFRLISGKRDHEEMKAKLHNRLTRCSFDLVAYETDMASVYAASDLIICRAGATSVAELAAAGVPSVLVPLPNAPRDHQSANAKALEDQGAAVVIADEDLDAQQLIATVKSLLSSPSRLAEMGSNAKANSRNEFAAAAVVDLLEKHAHYRIPVSRPPEPSDS